MLIFLLWRRSGNDASPDDVVSKLAEIFEPLLAASPRRRAVETEHAALAWLELDVRDWRGVRFEHDGDAWALSPDFPARATSLVSSRPLLPALGERLLAEPERLLDALAPPFSLLWHDPSTGFVHVQNDALGQAQLLEFDDGETWALTNRVHALRALDLTLDPVEEEWATRVALGWFPLQATGYRHLRMLEPGTRVDLAETTRRTRFDVLRRWVHPEPLGRGDSLEVGRRSVLRELEAAMSLAERPSVGLSGGHDTRAVVAALRSLGCEFRARVRDVPGRHDAELALELARRAGFELRVKRDERLPVDGSSDHRSAVAKALVWQGGLMDTGKHASLFAGERRLTGGVVNVMGQHGEIGRGYYARRVETNGRADLPAESLIVDRLLQRAPPYLRPEVLAHVRDVVRLAYRQADAYGLEGMRRLDFLYLFERTRRWASGSLASQSGVVVAPFLNPEFVRAVYGYPGADLDLSPFHVHIVETHAPEWIGVPYASDFTAPKRPTARAARLAVAKPIVHDALEREGLWTSILDPQLVAMHWETAPDAIMLLRVLEDVLLPRSAAAV